MLGFSHKKIAGLEIDEGMLAVCVLAKRGQAAGVIRLSAASSLGEITQAPGMQKAPVFIAMPAQAVLFKTFYVPAALGKSKHRQKDAMAFLVRQNLPFKLDECYWDTFIWKNNLTLIAAKKEIVERYISQLDEAGLSCTGVTVSASALYNVLIYNYPERKNDRCALLHIRHSSSDLVLYEPDRLWIYPLSMGRKDFGNPQETAVRLLAELQRTFNAHTLQHQQAAAGARGFFYLSGRGVSQELADLLKQSLPDYQLEVFDPFKKISGAPKDLQNPSDFTLAVGIGLSQLNIGAGLATDIIRGKVSKEKNTARRFLLQKAALASAIAAALALAVFDFGLYTRLKQQAASDQATQEQVSSMLPQAKALKAGLEKLQSLDGFLESRIKTQMLYLKVLATLSESKTARISIKDFSADRKETQLDVSLAGSASGYDDINNFLANLKKNPDIKNVKVVASTFPKDTQESKSIDFKVRFEVQL